MKIIFHKNFEKKYKKLPENIKAVAKDKISLFVSDPYNLQLNNHSLHGKYLSYRSFNITGDIRIIYKFLNKDTALLAEIGTHSKLYS
jgi:mRNA interferase YafQ